MNIQIQSRLTDFYNSIDALSKLTALENPNGAQRSQMASHMAIISALKAGSSREEICAWEEERFRKEMGMPSTARIRSDPGANEELKQFLLTGESRGAELPVEFRDNLGGGQSLSYSAGASGGIFAPFGYHSELVQSLTQGDSDILSPLFASQWDSETGQPTVTPSIDDNVAGTFAKSVIVAEAGQTTESDVIAASTSWPTCPTWRSGKMFMSIELITDSPILSTVIKTCIARRHILGISAGFITGLGNSIQPAGLCNSLPSSTTVTSAGTTLTLADFESVYAKQDAAYIKNSAWYMSNSTLTILIKLLESAGRPMIGPVRQFLQLPIAICNSMASVTAGSSAVVVLCNTQSISQRYVPKASAIRQYSQAPGYIEAGLIGVEGFCRADQRTILFSSNNPPVCSLNVHA